MRGSSGIFERQMGPTNKLAQSLTPFSSPDGENHFLLRQVFRPILQIQPWSMPTLCRQPAEKSSSNQYRKITDSNILYNGRHHGLFPLIFCNYYPPLFALSPMSSIIQIEKQPSASLMCLRDIKLANEVERWREIRTIENDASKVRQSANVTVWFRKQNK